MNNQGWFFWRRTFGWLIAPMGAVAVGLFAVTSVAAKSETTFDRLQALDREMSQHRRASLRAERALERRTRRLGEGTDQGALAERAHRRVRGRVARRLVGWEKLYTAAARRAPNWEPGRASDLRRLLEYAERTALPRSRDEFRALDRLRGRRVRPAVQLRRSATTAVELAQHRASESATKAEKESVVKEAKESDSRDLTEEMAESQEQLESTLRELIDHETGEDFHRRKGALLPPVDAELSHGFGEKKQRHSMTYVRHTGLTYRVEPGADVQTVAEGLVVHAQRFEGYGNLVIVDHGDGYHSLYAHLSEIEVEEGAELSQGQTVGHSGQTASLDGPKLYVELRKEGEPIDPEPWFVRSD